MVSCVEEVQDSLFAGEVPRCEARSIYTGNYGEHLPSGFIKNQYLWYDRQGHGAGQRWTYVSKSGNTVREYFNTHMIGEFARCSDRGMPTLVYRDLMGHST